MPKHKQTSRSAEVVPQSNILLQAQPALINRLRHSLSRTNRKGLKAKKVVEPSPYNLFTVSIILFL